MQKTWQLRPVPIEHNLSVNSDLLRQLLLTRGLTEQTEAEKFLAPDYERDLHDPFLMLDMTRAVDRILAALQRNERVAIFADYDADGVPGAAILTSFFDQFGYQNYTVYIPDRHDEAYGLNNEALAKLATDGATLLVTIDCGITDLLPVAEANRLGLEVIITDHHLPPPVLPEAYAIVNPKREGDPYPFKDLCGAGVVFKLIQALLLSLLARQKNRLAPAAPDLSLEGNKSAYDFSALSASQISSGWEKWLLDLVAIATVADMVPLIDENRALVHFGLKVLRQTRRPGLQKLFTLLGLDSRGINEDDIGFMIGPRLNSASRMSHGREAYALLMAKDEAEAERLARHLEGKNRERRTRVSSILEAVGAAEPAQTVQVHGDPDWALGVLGLVASRLVDDRRRPVFLWGRNGHGEIKGSCRSDGTVNVVELMKCANDSAGGELFINYGGHAGAGGFSLQPERLADLAPGLNEAYRALGRTEATEQILPYDLELKFEALSAETHDILEQLAPFGLENHKPVFRLNNLPILLSRRFGNGGGHLELTFAHSDLGSIKAVQFFSLGVNQLQAGDRVDILASLEKSYFRYKPELRLRLVDWRQSV